MVSSLPLDETLPTEGELGNLQRQQDLAHYINLAATQLSSIFAGSGLTLAQISDAGTAAGYPASAFVQVTDGIVVPTVLATVGQPADTVGNDGDNALDAATATVYVKASGAWSSTPLANLGLGNWNIRTSASTALTLAATDRGRFLRLTAATAITLTIPNDTTVTWNTGFGDHIRIQMAGAGVITVAAGSGVTRRSTSGTMTSTTQWQYADLVRVAANEWAVMWGPAT